MKFDKKTITILTIFLFIIVGIGITILSGSPHPVPPPQNTVVTTNPNYPDSTINNISWNNSNVLSLPKALPAYQLESQADQLVSRLISRYTLSQSSTTVFTSSEGTNLYYDQNKQLLILTPPSNSTGSIGMTSQQSINAAQKILQELQLEDIYQINPQQIIFSNAQVTQVSSSSPEEAATARIFLTTKIGDYPLLSTYFNPGSSFLQLNQDYQLTNLTLSPLPYKTRQFAEYNLISLEEAVNNLRQGLGTIISINDSTYEQDLSSTELTLDNTQLTEVELVYRTTTDNTRAFPQYNFYGTATTSSNQEVTLILSTPAVPIDS